MIIFSLKGSGEEPSLCDVFDGGWWCRRPCEAQSQHHRSAPTWQRCGLTQGTVSEM